MTNLTESQIIRQAKAKAGTSGGSAISAAASDASSSTNKAGAGRDDDKNGKTKTKKVKFHHLAWNMGMISSVSMIILGICTVVMGSLNSPTSWVWVGLYCCLIGLVALVLEFFYWQARSDSKIPLRAIFYAVISIYPFFAWPTAIVGFCMLCTAAINAASAWTEELVAPDEKNTPSAQLAAMCSLDACCSESTSHNKYGSAVVVAADDADDGDGQGAIGAFISKIRREGKVGRYIFYLSYFLLNAVLFIYHWADFAATNAAQPINLRLSGWVPFAKGFGWTLDLNCAMILVPMLRSGLRWLYNRSTQDQTWTSRALRNVLLFLPVDFSIAIHRMIAGYILVGFVGHSFAHLINWGLLPGVTLSVMGVWPILSGVLLLAVAFFIYAAAADNVKSTKFEYFYYTHHLFIVFFFLLLVHGRGFLGPNFWKFFLVPGSLYALERVFRMLKSKKQVSLLSVTLMRPNVISLEFDRPFKDGYQEGQYVFLRCPAVSENQWHPFTISSAPCEPTVTLHIRTWGEKSWTKKMCDYMTSMMPANATFNRFSHMGGEGNVAGKTTGPDGLALFNVDGPHAAPTQHAKEYSTVMVVGGGIGVTPLAATMKEVVFNRWKYGIGESFPDKAYFYWMVAYNELDSFRWFMRTVKECDDAFCDLSAKNQSMATKSFEFHIFITSAPKERDPASVKITNVPRADDEDNATWGRHVRREATGDNMVRTAQSIGAGYTELDLYRACKLLPVPAGGKADAPIHMGLVKHVHVWNGRPKWEQQFAAVVATTQEGEIGVTVCANPAICTDLEKYCSQFSAPANNRYVILHKENF